MSLKAAPSPLLADAASRSGPTTDASMIEREEGEEEEGFEPMARHRGVVFVFVAVAKESPSFFLPSLSSALPATLDSEFPRIATFLRSLELQCAFKTSSATGG